jgi:tRNA pseudouridine38-40 synthase
LATSVAIRKLKERRSTTEKTIEGDIFTAFVKAGAISKANAADPKKSSLVRCARTDKGVHAAGNIISLKLIVEDPDIVQKINEHLSPQIRVWGIQRTIGSFSCYQQCDSRWYEYLLPTHSLIPPHPSSYMGRKLIELAEQAGDATGYSERQSDLATFWDDIDEQKIKPQLETYDEQLQKLLRQALYEADAVDLGDEVELDPKGSETKINHADAELASSEQANTAFSSENGLLDGGIDKRRLEDAIKSLRSIYLSSKKAYRVSEYRLERLREILGAYVGTHRFHNYTIRMSYRDSSAKRHIKSFTVSKPFERDGTEWVSLKVHGQSFMMHQIRKMVGMASNMVRCGTNTERIADSFRDVEIAIPKAPGLGLLLERPVFSSYNKRVEENFPDKEQIDFGKWETEMEEFKQREIYARIFREEESMNQ